MERKKTTSIIKNWQTKTDMLLSIENLVRRLDFDYHPRINRAAFVDAHDIKEIGACFEELLHNPALPVVCMTTEKGEGLNYLLENAPLLLSLVRFPNVRMINNFNLVTDLPTLFQQPRFSFTQEQSEKTTERTRSVIRHEFWHASEGDTGFNKELLIIRARNELGLTGTDDEVVQTVMSPTSVAKPPEYMSINVAAVDWGGTLMQNGIFQEVLLRKIRNEAAQKNMPVMIWTGGEVETVYRVLKEWGISDLDVCAKQDCAGLEIAVAYDDVKKDSLETEYGFKIRTQCYIKLVTKCKPN